MGKLAHTRSHKPYQRVTHLGTRKSLWQSKCLWSNKQDVPLDLFSKLCPKRSTRAVDLEQNSLPSYLIRSVWHRKEKPQAVSGTAPAQTSVTEPQCVTQLYVTTLQMRLATRIPVTQHCKIHLHVCHRINQTIETAPLSILQYKQNQTHHTNPKLKNIHLLPHSKIEKPPKV